MIFETHTPQESIAPYIQSIFHYKHLMPDHSIERVVPTGHVFLLFELDGITRNTFDNESLKPNANFSKAWISGIHRQYISISEHENSEMLVIQFQPGGSYPFFHVAADMFTELVVPAGELVDDSLLQLRDRMVTTGSSEEKFSLAEDWLLQRFDSTRAPPLELLEFIQNLQQQPAACLNQLIEAYPTSQKNLIDQFKKYVGLTPKYYQRILRFNDVLQKINNKEEIFWTEIAYECGYSDQSHFIKEFRHFSGFNPNEFIKKEFGKEETNFFPLDRER